MANGGYEVHPEDLDTASAGIGSAVSAAGEPTLGGMSGGDETFGHSGVSSAFSAFVAHAGSTFEGLRQQAGYHQDGLSATSAQYSGTESDNAGNLSAGQGSL